MFYSFCNVCRSDVSPHSYNARVTCCISKPNYQRTKEQHIKFTQVENAKPGCKVIMPRFPEHTRASKQL